MEAACVPSRADLNVEFFYDYLVCAFENLIGGLDWWPWLVVVENEECSRIRLWDVALATLKYGLDIIIGLSATRREEECARDAFEICEESIYHRPTMERSQRPQRHWMKMESVAVDSEMRYWYKAMAALSYGDCDSYGDSVGIRVATPLFRIQWSRQSALHL